MAAMMDFSLWLLDSITVFLVTEPISYLFGLVLLMFVIKILLILIHGIKI